MWIENITYFVAFIVSAGMAALGILTAYQLFHQFKKAVFSILLYQQIFLFSFLVYSVWGNIVLRLVLSDYHINEALAARLAVFLPMIGLPFMIVSWYMLLKLGLKLNGFSASKIFPLSYFPTLIVTILVLDVLIQKNIIPISENPDLFIVRILTVMNFVVHLCFVGLFFLKKGNQKSLQEIAFSKREALQFLGLVLLYSLAMCFFNIFGFLSTCISIVLLFASGVYISFTMRVNYVHEAKHRNMHFHEFCKEYHISKREAEIILEICSGKTNKAIAEKLFITLQTVKDHNHRIFTKTQVKSRVQLANLVREKTGQ